MNRPFSRTHTTNSRAGYISRHDRQARTWTRFTSLLRDVRSGAITRKEGALAWCLQKNTRGFAIPVEVQRRPDYGFGWERLSRVAAEMRFPELEAKILYDDVADTEFVVLYVHYTERGICRKAPIGTLPEFDAGWMIPLLRDDLARWMNIFVVETTGDAVEIAISGSWVAAHYWIDGYDDRRAARADRLDEEENGYGGEDATRPGWIRAGAKKTRPEDPRTAIARLQSRIRAALRDVEIREASGQTTDHLYAYIAGLSEQIEYITSQIHREKSEADGIPHEYDPLREEDASREVPFSDLSGSEFWPIYRRVQ